MQQPTTWLAGAGEILAGILVVEPEYPRAAFAAIDVRAGSFETYLATILGVDAPDVAWLRAVSLE